MAKKTRLAKSRASEIPYTIASEKKAQISSAPASTIAEVRDQISASSGKRRAASTISTAMAVDRIRKMTDGIIEDVERAIDLQTALEAGNDTIREIQGDAPPLSFPGDHGYNAIRIGLTVSLVLTLAKLFDPAKLFVSRAKKGTRWRANKSDIVSIPLLVRLLKQRRCQASPGKHARGWTPTLDHMETVHEESAIDAANAAVGAYEDFRRTREGRSAARVLKIFRNDNLAHRLLDKSARPPRYRELFLLLDVAAKVAEKARLAVTGESWDVEDSREVRRTHSTAFWDPAIRGVIEANRRR